MKSLIIQSTFQSSEWKRTNFLPSLLLACVVEYVGLCLLKSIENIYRGMPLHWIASFSCVFRLLATIKELWNQQHTIPLITTSMNIEMSRLGKELVWCVLSLLKRFRYVDEYQKHGGKVNQSSYYETAMYQKHPSNCYSCTLKTHFLSFDMV